MNTEVVGFAICFGIVAVLSVGCWLTGKILSAISDKMLPDSEDDVQEKTDEGHAVHTERVEDEYYVQIRHEMTKTHYISFMAEISDDGIQIVKLYRKEWHRPDSK